MEPYIYKVTNKLDGKSYIGQHDGKKSWYYASGTYVKRAIAKYGKTNFIREIIDSGDYSKEELDMLEQYYIKLHRTYAPDYPDTGYNLTKGGDGKRGHKPSAETKLKCKLNSATRKDIVQLTLDGAYVAEFTSINDAGRICGLDGSCINRACNGKLSVYAEHHWVFKTDYTRTDFALPTVRTGKKSVGQYDKSGELLAVFDSAGSAAEYHGISRAAIANVLCGNAKKAAGYFWRFA